MAIRLKTTVIGNASVNATDAASDSIVTFQYADLFTQASPQSISVLMNPTLGALFTIGQLCNFYISLNPTEVTQIEGSGITVTPLTQQD